MEEDIRDKPYLTHEDIIGLNFIRAPWRYEFKRHYRQGLRSHIMEVIDRDDIARETRGVVMDGIRWFPRARPLKMFRLFRTKFGSLEEAFEEVKTVKIIEGFLAPGHMALSNEFLVHYNLTRGSRHIILCGLQDYVEGEILDPWGPINRNHLKELLRRMGGIQGDVSEMGVDLTLQRIRQNAEEFIKRVKDMILEANYLPDLAGMGNLLLMPSGNIKLVDINNISKVTFQTTISLDDKGYPVCDKSVEALWQLEQKLLGRPMNKGETIYKVFLDPGRMKEVKALEKKFHLSMR